MSEQWKRYSRLCLYKFIFLVASFILLGASFFTLILQRFSILNFWQGVFLCIILFGFAFLSNRLAGYFGMEARKLYTVVTPEEIQGPNWRLSEEEALKVLEEYKKEHETKKEIEGGN